ncbi:uncharacterized protein LOC142093109 [Calonectris borealis]|uniref:uncharacterized protein LOC142093109 n=1 Tax=Calonectris borealis TaxID=1323832 RepID=UPI003F4C3B0A
MLPSGERNAVLQVGAAEVPPCSTFPSAGNGNGILRCLRGNAAVLIAASTAAPRAQCQRALGVQSAELQRYPQQARPPTRTAGSVCVTNSVVQLRSARASEPRKPHLVRAARYPRILLGGGQQSDRSYRRGREERRRKKHLNCQILPVAPRARAAVNPRALRALSPLSWVLGPPAPLLAPPFSHAAVYLGVVPPPPFFFPVPLLFSLFFCPAHSSSLPFSRSTVPFSFSLCAFVLLCLPPFYHPLSLSCRPWPFFPFPSLCPDLHLSLFSRAISLACFLAFFSFLCLYVLLCVPAFLSLPFLPSLSIPLFYSLLLVFFILFLIVPVLLPVHLLLSVTLCAAPCPSYLLPHLSIPVFFLVFPVSLSQYPTLWLPVFICFLYPSVLSPFFPCPSGLLPITAFSFFLHLSVSVLLLSFSLCL